MNLFLQTSPKLTFKKINGHLGQKEPRGRCLETPDDVWIFNPISILMLPLRTRTDRTRIHMIANPSTFRDGEFWGGNNWSSTYIFLIFFYIYIYDMSSPYQGTLVCTIYM